MLSRPFGTFRVSGGGYCTQDLESYNQCRCPKNLAGPCGRILNRFTFNDKNVVFGHKNKRRQSHLSSCGVNHLRTHRLSLSADFDNGAHARRGNVTSHSSPSKTYPVDKKIDDVDEKPNVKLPLLVLAAVVAAALVLLLTWNLPSVRRGAVLVKDLACRISRLSAAVAADPVAAAASASTSSGTLAAGSVPQFPSRLRSLFARLPAGTLHALSLVLFSEIGDKTFFLAAVLAMRHGALVSLAGSVVALSAMTFISVAIGTVCARFPKRLHATVPLGELVATALFAVFGVKALLEAMAPPDEEGCVLLEDAYSERLTLLSHADKAKSGGSGGGGGSGGEELVGGSVRRQRPEHKGGDDWEQKKLFIRLAAGSGGKSDQVLETDSELGGYGSGNVVFYPSLLSNDEAYRSFPGPSDSDAVEGAARFGGLGIVGPDKSGRLEITAADGLEPIVICGERRRPTLLQQLLEVVSVIFLAEWGDRSMLATVVLSASQGASGVCLGATVGHALASALAVLFGGVAARHLSERTAGLASGAIFLFFFAAGVFNLLK